MTTKLLLGLTLLALPQAHADTLSLYNWGFNVDGTAFPKPGPLPVLFNTSGFSLTGEGLGSMTIAVAGPPGAHYADIFFNYQLLASNPGADLAAAVGTLAAGESWEIGTPTQVLSGLGSNNYDDTNNTPGPANEAVGLGFAFTTTATDPVGLITINVSETAPTSGFYIEQWNSSATPSEIYISASEVNTPAPEPSSLLLLGAGLCGIVRVRKKA